MNMHVPRRAFTPPATERRVWPAPIPRPWPGGGVPASHLLPTARSLVAEVEPDPVFP